MLIRRAGEQNSVVSGDGIPSELQSEQVPRLARKQRCLSVAYTYTEPLVYYENTLDCAMRARDIAREEGLCAFISAIFPFLARRTPTARPVDACWLSGTDIR